MNAPVKPLKAYAVLELDEWTGSIYFERHAIAARRAGADEFACGDLSQVECRRAPWADVYAGKRLPASVMVAHGWHFECSGCGDRIDEDGLVDRGLSVDGVIGSQYSAVYCCGRCYRHDQRLAVRRKAEEAKAISDFKSIVRKRFPDAEFCDDEDRFRGHHAYVTQHRGFWHREQVVVAFRFPGMKIGPAHYRTDWHVFRGMGPVAAGYTCCNGDREAFEAYARRSRS